ncbi:alpha/beta hydrolase [Lewinella sp. IMCC34183]|uniref:alpha/beta hydrolase n=1 Tax=Lewinella sp. IMCC34183 TaxID=2248762 RepID=UPI000E236122|nr:alpha/beta hydrolase family protein [Lewinella sp. IMCC34183]
MIPRIPSLLFCLLLFGATATAATVDTIQVPSTVMGKDYKAVVILPDSYKTEGGAHPVLYLLHGGLGHFDDWILKLPEPAMLTRLADENHLIIVMPEGEWFSYYLDSPVLEDSQFETYITQEVIGTIDRRYKTIARREGRVVTGLSMGGYGSLYLSARHPDLFCAAGSMSGALNPDMAGWNLPPQATEDVGRSFARILGPKEGGREVYREANVLSYADSMQANDVALIFDCGVDDFLIEPNRELHRRLVFNGTPHDYSERPGGHSWPYWSNSLPYHVLFFRKVLETNGSLRPRN